MSITFERIERDCEYNKVLRASGAKTGILYDFKVLIGGEHRATIHKISHGIGYRLLDIDGRDIKEADNHRHAYKIDKQACFERDINLLWSKDRIPTLAQIEERRAERAREKAKRDEAEAAQRRIHRIERHALELLAALRAFVAATDPACLVEHDSPHAAFADALRAGHAAIAKATGAES